VPAAGYEIDFLEVRGLDRRNPLRAAVAAGKAAKAVGVARKLLEERGADAVMGGGGYVAGPAGLAASRLGLPLILTEADSHLGITNRILARRARRVCLAFELEGRTGSLYLHTGRPVPRAILEADPAQARARFGVAPQIPCLLIFGGSQGARTINDAAAEAFADQGGERAFHVLHVCGTRDYEAIAERVGSVPLYTLIDYLPDLGDALAACNLVLARSGGSVFEMTAAGRPAVLVPYPYASANHQHANARWMADAGAALVVEDSELTPEWLERNLSPMLADQALLERMSSASRAIAKPDAAERIAAEILSHV
jgi:UDP-N-acetylglucosamine--N-acetylmuramyl-(pentapeptide) pyrophosphoryl-undecaprenol N-acetylglucosamine transferase